MPIKQTTTSLLDHPVNLVELVRKVGFDVDNLDEAGMEQSKLFLEAGRFRVQKVRKHSAAKQEYERVYAEQRIAARRITSGGKKKYTEGGVSDKASVVGAVAQAQKAMDAAAAEEEWAKVLTEAYKQRAQMIMVLGRIQASEISSEVKAAQHDVAKATMNKMKQKLRAQTDAKYAALEDEEEDEG